MPVVEIYGCAVIEHSKYKGTTIYKGEDNRWFAEYSDGTGWTRIIENGSLQDLKIEINNLVKIGKIKPRSSYIYSLRELEEHWNRRDER